VFFPFKPRNVDEKSKESSHGLLIQKKISYMYQTLAYGLVNYYMIISPIKWKMWTKNQKNHPMGSVHPFQRKAHPYTKTY
jgi:hypothetical protein